MSFSAVRFLFLFTSSRPHHTAHPPTATRLLFYIPLSLYSPSTLSLSAVVTMPSTHNVDKPWDTDDIDKWKVRPPLRCANSSGPQTNIAPHYRSMNSNPKITKADPFCKSRRSKSNSPNTANNTSAKHGLVLLAPLRNFRLLASWI